MHTNLIQAENGKPIVAQKVVIVPRVLRQDVGDRDPFRCNLYEKKTAIISLLHFNCVHFLCILNFLIIEAAN